ncbi:hypothetical protein B0T24DRAFT_668898 [Lasiosphaeria ovina]|uniref:Uncharacterized protein n=1 Tax=Lasiosphaeria ovina TaxID=92902 RepID=A0AAE0K3Q0_9PEZI|nr:hypothetical protein B0T24DRAFT_668898 [Lasiosphaeria ovina]
MASPTTTTLNTRHAVRLAARSKALTGPTAGPAPTCLQANLIVLPSRYAADLRLLCARNFVPCPLLAESAHLGAFSKLRSCLSAPIGHNTNTTTTTSPPPLLKLASDIDLRTDAPAYRIYQDGQLVTTTSTTEHPDITATCQATDHVRKKEETKGQNKNVTMLVELNGALQGVVRAGMGVLWHISVLPPRLQERFDDNQLPRSQKYFIRSTTRTESMLGRSLSIDGLSASGKTKPQRASHCSASLLAGSSGSSVWIVTEASPEFLGLVDQ